MCSKAPRGSRSARTSGTPDARTGNPLGRSGPWKPRREQSGNRYRALSRGTDGDGGIDGLGVYVLVSVSFPVFFQCKRYLGSVGPSAARRFRGAMAGRGDKGLLITTGSFTTD